MSHRLVVVGHGMVASRFLSELAAHQLDIDVTVLGDEPQLPYNRLLLAEVVHGRYDLDALTLPPAASARVLTGRRAVNVDRRRNLVLDALGEEHPYDTLVLATGASPAFPAVDGLVGPDGRPLPGVAALRTFADAVGITEALAAARGVVVLGGGLLGLEAASAMAGRGVDVTVVHKGGHLLDRQLDPASGAVVRAALADRGVRAVTSARIAHVDRPAGGVRRVRLTDDTWIACGLIVVAAGVTPRTRLAREADLWVRHGVLVDDRLRTDDPHIYAIGDCARTRHGCPGLLAPGWEHARQLAGHLVDRLAGRPPQHAVAPTPSSVVRLKADGLDVVTMGRLPDDDLDPAGPRVVSLVDLAGRRRVRVAIENGRIAGATCVGDPDVAADLTIAFEQGFAVPDDPAALLARPLRSAVAAVASVVDLPDGAVVCRCNAVTKSAIGAAVLDGAATADDVADRTRATTGCGSCAADVCTLVAALATPAAGDPHQSAVVA